MKRTSAWLVVVGLVAAFGLGVLARPLLGVGAPPPPSEPIEPVQVRVKSGEGVATTRAELARYLFGADGFPGGRPTDHGDGTYTIELPGGLSSVVRVLPQPDPNGRLVLYHAGHVAFGDADRPMVEALVANGFTVAIFDMPLVGANATPVRVVLPNGPVTLSRHDHLAYLDEQTEGSPIRLFVEPVVVMLNELADRYQDVSMVGLSGGGWTTTLAAAIDPRIDRSYPVAGTVPLAVRLVQDDSWGDWEQTEPSLYEIAGYEDLYVLGSFERRQLQVLNLHDPCCFGGDHRHVYLAQVQAALAAAGPGSFDVHLDLENRDHSIGPDAIAVILADLSRP